MDSRVLSGVITGVVILLLVGIMLIYNRLVRLYNMVRDQWSQIDILLKKRADLVPNLVAVVKIYAMHEKSTFAAIAAARQKFVIAKTPEDKIQTFNHLEDLLNGLGAVVEAYPALKASQNFQQLQSTLEALETEIAHSRQFYNAVTRKYNHSVKTFPAMLVAKVFHFRSMPYFTDQSSQDKR